MRCRTNHTMTQPIKMRTAYCQPEGWTGIAERLSVLEAIDHLRGKREFNKGFGTEIRNLILASSWANSYFWLGRTRGWPLAVQSAAEPRRKELKHRKDNVAPIERKRWLRGETPAKLPAPIRRAGLPQRRQWQSRSRRRASQSIGAARAPTDLIALGTVWPERGPRRETSRR